MNSRVLPTVAFCGLLGGCGAAPTVIPARNLERPGDMGFVCLAVDANNTLSGQPMSVCHPPGQKDPVIQASSSSPRQLGTFALVTNTARGEMAAIDIDKNRLIDLDPVVFGFNMVPVGSMPENLAASPDGCWVMSANRASCDLGLLSPSFILASLFTPAEPASNNGPPVSRIVPRTKSSRSLNASPKEIAFLLPPTAPSCQTEQALVTFPSCDLVALLDIPSGRILDSVYVRSEGIVRAGAEPTCPADCEGPGVEATPEEDGGTVAPASDGGVSDGQANAPAYLGVGALALLPDSSRVYVGGSAADDFITALDIVGGAISIPADGGQIALEPGAIGIDHMRLSVDPFKSAATQLADGTWKIDNQGSFVEERGRFLYAFARDGSVRVVNVGVRPEHECDVNARPDLAGLPADTGCFPVNPKARNPLAQGPGIRIPTLPVRTAAPAIPRDIAVVDLPVDAAGIVKNPQALAGQFAFLLASNDAVYVLNLAPHTVVGVDNQEVSEQDTPTHSFREVRATGQYVADMLVLSSTPPLRTPVPSDLLFPTTPILSSLTGPRLEKVTDATAPVSRVSTNYTTTDYWADFPYRATYVSRALSIAWEDTLSGTTRSSGILRDPTSAGTAAGELDDAGADFCARGVLVGDLVVLPGCSVDTDCDPQDTFFCRQPVSGATGVCLPKSADQTLLDSCARFSSSRRRYEVLLATPTQLKLGLHLDEVPKTSLNRVAASQQDSSGRDAECQPTDAHKPSGTRLGFTWQQVWPGETFKRCVEPCASSSSSPPSASDRDCRPGFVCEAVPGSLPAKLPRPGQAPAGYCVEAPPLNLACWPQPSNRYHVNAGASFLISGTSLPDLPVSRVVGGQCQIDPSRDPVLANRIPMSAPECATIDGVVPIGNVSNTQVALFGQATPPIEPASPQESGSPATPNPPNSPINPPGPNPCLYQDFNYDDPAKGPRAIKALFQNPQIRFVLTNLDQYGGDSLVTRLNLTGGFVPATVAIPSYDVALTQPIRIFTGPSKLPDSPLMMPNPTSQISYPYVYVLDQGRTALTPNSRGQIVRINARKGDSALTTFDPATSGTTPFQIQ